MKKKKETKKKTLIAIALQFSLSWNDAVSQNRAESAFVNVRVILFATLMRSHASKVRCVLKSVVLLYIQYAADVRCEC